MVIFKLTRTFFVGKEATLLTITKSNPTARPLRTERKPQPRTGALGELSPFSWLRGMVTNKVDLWKVSDSLNVNPSTVQKILEGNPVSRSVTKKINAAFEQGGAFESKRTRRKDLAPNHSTVERLMEVYALYEKEKSLRTVGKKLDLSFERVRQLLEKGSAIGLFKYQPPKAPVLSREKILKDYKKFLKRSRVAKANHISVNYLSKLIAQYRITDKDLEVTRVEGQKIQCVKQYDAIARKLGYHPTTTELHRTKSARSLAFKIRRAWGSLEQFRKERNITPGQPVSGRPDRQETHVLAGV